MEYHIFVSGNLTGFISDKTAGRFLNIWNRISLLFLKNFEIICHKMELWIVTIYVR